MALLDRDRNQIVLRIVYDGPPEAGKTTSLRALAGRLGQTVYTPEEQSGRTLYFDWMDYTGGRFEGHPIRCQIVSVPGQRHLQDRRRHLLGEADAIVFVADTTRPRMPETLERLRELPHLVDRQPPPVGVILQANKRDAANAVPMQELRAKVREVAGEVGIVETVAQDGSGIRETFVFAVRLALDRVRELVRTDSLRTGPPSVNSADELLAAMRSISSTSATPADDALAAAPLFEQVLVENDPSIVDFVPWRDPSGAVIQRDGPLPPDASAPSGAIWPPVEGRIILHEASANGLITHRLRSGGWAAGIGNGWRAFSAADAEFGDLDAGREMLIRQARLHVVAGTALSPSRCVVLAATGQGTHRIWQLVRAEPSLRDYLEDIDRQSTETAAARILEVATALCEVSPRLQAAPCHLPCTLDTIGRGSQGPVYIGLMPMDTGSKAAPLEAEPLGSELVSLFYNALYDRRAEVLDAIARTRHAGTADPGADLLQNLFATSPA